MDFRSNRKSTNKNKWLIVGGVVATVLLVIGLIIGYSYWQAEERREQADVTAYSFVEALENQDYEEISSMLSDSSLEDVNYTREEVQERYETIYGGIGASELLICSDLVL